MGTAGSSYCVQKIIARRTYRSRGWVERKFFRHAMAESQACRQKLKGKSHKGYNSIACQPKSQLTSRIAVHEHDER